MRDILQTDLIRIKLYTFHVSVSIMMVRKDLVKLLPCFFCNPTLRMCACPNDDKIGNLLIYNMFIIKCIPNKFDVFIKCRNREYIGNNNRQHTTSSHYILTRWMQGMLSLKLEGKVVCQKRMLVIKAQPVATTKTTFHYMICFRFNSPKLYNDTRF